MPKSAGPSRLFIFHTPLGWMAARCAGRSVQCLTLGHPTAQAAAEALDSRLEDGARPDAWGRRFIARLRAYAAGRPVSFRDIAVDFVPATEFQRRVYALCRRIPHGKTRTYAELAALAGSPGAARAVGNCMARNPVPLVIPCHRVVGSHGRLGGFSAPGGTRTKGALLSLEKGETEKLAWNRPAQ